MSETIFLGKNPSSIFWDKSSGGAVASVTGTDGVQAAPTTGAVVVSLDVDGLGVTTPPVSTDDFVFERGGTHFKISYLDLLNAINLNGWVWRGSLDATLASLPVSPANGDAYFITVGGDFAGTWAAVASPPFASDPPSTGDTVVYFVDSITPANSGWVKVEGLTTAQEVSYDNTLSGLLATNVQDAIDELAASFNAMANIFYVAVNGSDITGDGSEHNPWASIQHAVNNATDESLILVAPSGMTPYVGNVTVFDRIGIRISAFSPVASFSDVKIAGNLLITGSNAERISLSGLNFGGSGTVSGGQGNHFFEKTLFNSGFQVSGAFTNTIVFDQCSINGQMLLGGTPSNATVIIKDHIGTASHLTQISQQAAYTTFVLESNFLDWIDHQDGVMILKEILTIVPTGAGPIFDAVVSSANAGVLSCYDVNMVSNLGVYSRFNKTGTCPWVISQSNRDPSIDILTGPRFLYGQPAVDIGWDNTGTSLVADNVQDAIQELALKFPLPILDLVADFGADPTGVLNSSVQFNAFLAAGGQDAILHIPAGTYLLSGSHATQPNTIIFGEGAVINFDFVANVEGISLASGTKIHGVRFAPQSSIVPTVGNHQASLVLGNYGSGSGVTDVDISSCIFDGLNAAVGGGTSGIFITGDTSRVKVSNINFTAPTNISFGIALHWGNANQFNNGTVGNPINIWTAGPDYTVGTRVSASDFNGYECILALGSGASNPAGGASPNWAFYGNTTHPHDIILENVHAENMTVGIVGSFPSTVTISGAYNVTLKNVSGVSGQQLSYIFAGDYGNRFAGTKASLVMSGILLDAPRAETSIWGVRVEGAPSKVSSGNNLVGSVLVQNGVLRGDETSSGNGLNVGNFTGFVARNCDVRGFASGFATASNVIAPLLEGCIFNDNMGPGVRITDNAGPPRGIVVKNCIVQGNARAVATPFAQEAGIYVANSIDTLLDGNNVGYQTETFQTHGIRWENTAQNIKLVNNHVNDTVGANAAYTAAGANVQYWPLRAENNTANAGVPYSNIDIFNWTNPADVNIPTTTHASWIEANTAAGPMTLRLLRTGVNRQKITLIKSNSVDSLVIAHATAPVAGFSTIITNSASSFISPAGVSGIFTFIFYVTVDYPSGAWFLESA